MIDLTGTDKQITWATDIRNQMVSQVATLKEQLAAAATRKPGQDHLLAATIPAIDSALADMLREHTDAGWWIDNRFNTFTIIKKAASAAAHQAA